MLSGSRLGKGLVSLVSGRLVSGAISILSGAVLARLLTPADFGFIAAAFVVLALGNVVFDGAFGVNLIRRAELGPDDVPTTVTAAILLGLVLALLIIALAPLVEDVFGFPGLAAILVWCSATLPLKAVAAVAGSVLQREGRFAGIAISSTFGQVAGYVLVAIPLAIGGASVWALVAAVLVSGLVEAIWLARQANLVPRLAWHRDALADIRNGSLFSAANVLNWAANTSANAIVGGVLSAIDLGLYSRGWKLLDLFVAATSSPLSGVLLPFFASKSSDPKASGAILLSVLNIALPIYAVASVIVVIQAPFVVWMALGSQWSATIPVVQCLFAALVPRCAYKISEVFAVAKGHSAATFARQGAYAALMTVGALIGVSHGILGVAIAVCLAITAFYGISMIYAASIAGVPFLAIISVHLRAAFLALIVALVDLAILTMAATLPSSIAHAIAALGATSVAVLCTAAAPLFYLGPQGGAFMRTAMVRAFRRVRMGGGA